MLQDRSPQKPKNVILSKGSPSRFNRQYVAPKSTFRQCTLVKTVPDRIFTMPAQTNSNAAISNRKGEVKLVSEKVAKTKTEIELLKAQLQQLLNDGINKTNSSETNQATVTVNTPCVDTEKVVNEIKGKTFKDNVADIFTDTDVLTRKVKFTPIRKPKSNSQQNVQTEQPCKKERHYDQEVAREYIKRQREKRRQEINNRKKEIVSFVDVKKQRLQELREKSLKLVSKNLKHNRARSRSRSRETLDHAKKVEKCEVNGINSRSCEQLDVPHNDSSSSHNRRRALSFIHPHLQNITIRSPHTDSNVDVNCTDLEKHGAAVKIQAVYRGFRQRKMFRAAQRKQPEKAVASKEVQTNSFLKTTPNIVPYPYNFINAVKRKLNLVTQQASINTAATELKSPLDLKSFLSNKCLDLDIKSIEQLTLQRKSNSNSKTNLENGCASESDTSKNIPELSSESSVSEIKKSVRCSKRSHSSDTEQEPKLSINVDHVKKLKLRKPKPIDLEVSEQINGSRESIIAYNKCNYVVPNKISAEDSKSNASIVQTESAAVPKDDTLNSFREYMKENEDAVTYNLDKENLSPVTHSVQQSNKELQNYSSNFTTVTSEIPLLQPPSVSLKSSLPITTSEDTDGSAATNGGPATNAITNIKLVPGEKTLVESKVKTNEIHLKFEAELHLLNDFNDSLRQVMAVEKSLLELHNKRNEAAMTFHTRDTQTSVVNPQSQIATINYSRGSDVTEALSIDKDMSIVTTGLELSSFHSPIEESHSDNSIVKENFNNLNAFTGLSLEMFERLIKDEDARIENLKAILKVREKALVDRTKGELAWLEIQKKHLRDAGQLQEISVIKKKQRGLLIKLEHERHEMQRLKQMQKAASKERKSELKGQRNMIKAQLSAGNTVTKIKRHTREERRQSGPIKVYNSKSQSESVLSETSIATRKSSITEEIISTVSHSHSIVSQISEEVILSEKLQVRTNKQSNIRTETVKRSLLMREASLQTRRKVAEGLLQWHQRLLEEERQITELELAASAIMNQLPNVNNDCVDKSSVKQNFKGSQLNQLWFSMTGRQEKKFKDEEIYSMSQNSLEKFCKNAKNIHTHKQNRSVDSRKSQKSKTPIPVDELNKSFSSEVNEYISDFESAITSEGPILNGHLHSESSLSDNDQINTITEISKQKTEVIDQKSSLVDEIESLTRSPKDDTSEPNDTIKSDDLVDESEKSVIVEENDVTSKQSMVTEDNTAEDEQEDENNFQKAANEILSEIDKYLDSQISKDIEISEHTSNCKTGDSKSTYEDGDKSINSVKVSNCVEHNNCKQSTINEKSDSSKSNTGLSSISDLNKKNKRLSESHEDHVTLNSVAEISEDVLSRKSSENELSSDVSELKNNDLTSQTIEELTNHTTSKITNNLVNEEGLKSADHLNKHTTDSFNSKYVDDHSTNVSDNVKLISESDNHDFTSKTIEELSSCANVKITNDSVEEVEDDLKSDYVDDHSSNVSDNVKLLSELENRDFTGKTIEDLTNCTNAKITNDSVEEVKDLNTADASNNHLSKSFGSKYVDGLLSNVSDNNVKLISELIIHVSENKLHSNLNQDESPSETIDSISDIDEDQLSNHQYSTNFSVNDDEDHVSKNNEINETLDRLIDKVNDKFPSSKSSDTEIPSHETSSKLPTDASNRQPEIESPVKDNETKEIQSHEHTAPIEEIREESDTSQRSEQDHELEQVQKSANAVDETSSEDASSKVKTESPLLLSYGFIESKKTIESDSSDSVNLLQNDEDKISEHPSVTNTSCSLPSDNTVVKSDESVHTEKQTDDHPIDIKKRVLEILADANISSPRGDRSPRMQDFYVTAYDIASPNNSPELTSPTDDEHQSLTPQNASDEVEELLKKQLAIEQEIKEIQQQQQKEQLPYLYVREIPNKPPPPYTPPVITQSTGKDTALPIGENQINIITKASSEILHKAFKQNNLRNITLSENAKKILDLKSNIEGRCYEFIFDLCKEVAIDHYKQFERETGPTWMQLEKRKKLAIGNPFDQRSLEKLVNKKVKEVLGFEIVKTSECSKHKWSGKKRDHVDELLAVESQAEEADWTNYDRDELIVKDELTKEIMNMLLTETGQVLNNVLTKKKYLS